MRDVKDLAVMGGTPAFDRPLHVGRPNVGDRQALHDRIDAALDRTWLSNDGQLLREFESRMAEYLGVKHFFAVCNGTVALQIMIRACDLTGEVIIPSFTFIATAHALEWQNVEPVFCDVDPKTHNMDPKKVEALITDRTSGIMGVHVWGRPSAIDELQEIADRRGLTLVFDAAHALGCSFNGRMLGNFGRAECFSFHATKFFNTFEGGAIATNDDEIAARCRLMRNFGFDGPDHVVALGINGKMNEACAAMALTNLDSLSEFIDTNTRNHQGYAECLAAVPGVELALYPDDERSNRQYVVIEVDETVAGITRDELHAVLAAEKVLARKYFYPGCHMMEPYCSRPLRTQLPETVRLVAQVLSLPTGTAVGEREIRDICDIIASAVGGADQVRAALGGSA
jgi:dTDP-4-amino-4,6-dideoxygalactose transaminase